MNRKTENLPITMDRMNRNDLPAVFGLIGHPLGHSFSAAYFAGKFKNEGLQGFSYLNFDLSDLEAGIPALKADARCRGFNVTVPYKQEIIRFLDTLSPQAAQIGAVNTVKVEEDGRWTGYNTDYIGFYDSLARFMPEEIQAPALVLGNGGASQAVQYALHRHGREYFLLCRNPQQASNKAFRPRETFSYSGITPQVVEECRLIINTTRLGMFPQVDSCPEIPYRAVSPRHYAFDLVYNPETTAFMRRCSEQGARVMNGLDMLHRQAEAAWKIWQGIGV